MTKSKAVVLHSLKYGDSQLIVEMLTEALGRLTFICRIPKTAKGKVKKQFFQPLTLLDLEFDYRPSAQMQHLRDVRVWQPYESLPFDAVKLSVGLFVAEFLLYATRDEQQNVPLFQYVVNSLLWLDSSQGHFANFHLVFMIHLSRFIGFYPNVEGYQPGVYFDMRSGSFCTAVPSHRYFLRAAEAEKIGLLLRMDYPTMHLFAMSRTERNRCLDLILAYYRLHIDGFPELKSPSILRELF